MDGQQATRMQLQLRQNSEDLQSFLRDLDSWEEEIKEKDESLKQNKPILKEKLPPVRGQGPRPAAEERDQKKRKKKRREVKVVDGSGKDGRIRSFDYRAWDKFDVERACEEVDYKVRSSSSSEEEGEEGLEGGEALEGGEDEGEEELKKQRAVLEKEKGNALFKKGQFELAVESYTVAVELDPLSAVLPANRAMALIKLERYAAAEKDCSVALALDGSYVKAYLRRGVTRACLGRREEAREDFRAVLKLEPGNKQAQAELAKIEKLPDKACDPDTQECEGLPKHVTAVNRPPHLRSKKPLKRVWIEDVGGCEESLPPTVDVAKQTQPADPVKPVKPVKPEVDSPGTAAAADNSTDSEMTSDGRTFLDTATSTCKPEGSSGILTSGKSDGARDISTSSVETDSETHSQFKAASSSLAAAPPRMVPPPGQLPRVPETSLQFQADWKTMKKQNGALLSQYFKSLPPSKYPLLLQQSLETSTFPEIVSILHSDFVKCGKSCLEELRWLTKVKRFSVSVMFLSRQEKASLLQLFKDLQAVVLTDSEQAELNELAHQFCVKL